MIIAYSAETHFIPQVVDLKNLKLITEAIWIDLLSPTKEEEDAIEAILQLDIPTLEEMREIEFSSRLYVEDNILFMTATMVAHSDSINPSYDAVTFALTETQLITIRYIEPQAFKLFSNLLHKSHKQLTAMEVFISLLESTIDRLADVLEYVGHGLDECSKNIFASNLNAKSTVKPDYQKVMQIIGRKSNLSTKARESLVGFSRLVTFFGQTAHAYIDREAHARLTTLTSDLGSLTEYSNFISSKINFLLDATLGMISIEQSAIIKIFSVAAVIFLPPTLIASIYGMNFQYMPELSYKGGYFGAIILMVISAWLPYKYFKYRRWL